MEQMIRYVIAQYNAAPFILAFEDTILNLEL